MKNLKFLSAFIIMTAAVMFWGCGEDTPTGNNNGGGGSPPAINMKVNSFYAFTNDSLDTNGTTVRHTRLMTYQTFLAQGTFFSQPNAFQIRSETRDTVSNSLVGTDTFYVRYDGTRFYQYGLLRLIDSTQPPSWDLVADFSKPVGEQWSVATINTTIGGFAVTAVVKGKIADQIAFTTNNTNITINNYRIEIEAAVSTAAGSLGSIFVDYHIGYSDPTTNPAGMVRVKLRPVKLALLGIPVYRAAGVDSKIEYYVIP
jgi:hypothetical protein